MSTSNRYSVASLIGGILCAVIGINLALDGAVQAQTEGPTCDGVQQPPSPNGESWLCCDDSTWYDSNSQGCCFGSYFDLATEQCCYPAEAPYNTATEGCCYMAGPDAIYDLATECCCGNECIDL